MENPNGIIFESSFNTLHTPHTQIYEVCSTQDSPRSTTCEEDDVVVSEQLQPSPQLHSYIIYEGPNAKNSSNGPHPPPTDEAASLPSNSHL
jgi:hypothetical protein